MLYLYAFVNGVAVLGKEVGLGGRPLELVPLGSLDGVVSRHGEIEPEVEADALAAHAAVVETLMGRTEELVPARFGSVFEDEPSLRTATVARQRALEDALRKVRGRVEFGLHVVRHRAASAEEAPTGRSRLLGKLEQLRSAEDAARLDEPLVQAAVDCRRRVLRTPRLLLSGVYLVERSHAAEFAGLSRSIAEHPPGGVEVLATGPWPPYSFAEPEDGLRAA